MMDDFEAIKRLIGEPHRLTRAEGEAMLFRNEIDPFTGRPTGRKYLDPLLRSALEQQGHDPDVLLGYYEASKANDPTIIDGTVVSRDG